MTHLSSLLRECTFVKQCTLCSGGNNGENSSTHAHTLTDKRKRATDDDYDNDSMSNFLLYFEIEATVRITHDIHMYVYVDRINSSL